MRINQNDNPYLVLEGAWRSTKQLYPDELGGGDDRRARSPDSAYGDGASSPGSATAVALGSRDGSCYTPPPLSFSPTGSLASRAALPTSCTDGSDGTDTETSARRLNLSAICISNILMLEDRHLPSIFIRMYEQCLQIGEQEPMHPENGTRLRLLNYVIQRWHETRTRLNFYRDVMRIVGAVSRPLLGDHVNVAVESTKIDQQHVMRELMQTLRREVGSRTLGEYLESYSVRGAAGGKSCGDQFSFNDMALELFTRDDVQDYERGGQSTSGGVGGLVAGLMQHPLASYGRRVALVMLQSLCRLKLRVPSSVTSKLFAPSVPSWVEEDTETGMIHLDEQSKRRVAQAKENITRMLLRRKRAFVASPDTATNPLTTPSAHVKRPKTTTTTLAEKVEDVVTPLATRPGTPASPVFPESPPLALDDSLTVDTESFIAFPAAEERAQRRSLSALHHLERTVHQVNTVDDRFRTRVSTTNIATEELGVTRTDHELLRSLQQHYPTTNEARKLATGDVDKRVGGNDCDRETIVVNRATTDALITDNVEDNDDDDDDDDNDDDDDEVENDDEGDEVDDENDHEHDEDEGDNDFLGELLMPVRPPGGITSNSVAATNLATNGQQRRDSVAAIRESDNDLRFLAAGTNAPTMVTMRRNGGTATSVPGGTALVDELTFDLDTIFEHVDRKPLATVGTDVVTTDDRVAIGTTDLAEADEADDGTAYFSTDDLL